MTLETTEPTPTWDAQAHRETVNVLEAAVGDVQFKVWGADWCGDCRAVLPDFFAALDAAGVPDDDVAVYEVDDDKNGELTDEYDVELIATIVVERVGSDGADGREAEEVARFEEEEAVPAARYIADQLEAADALA